MNAALISAPDVERVVLASMLATPAALRAGLDALGAQIFYVSANQVLFQALADMAQADIPVDVITLTDYLARTNRLDAVGGIGYLAELVETVGSAVNIDHYARILQDRALRRAIAAECAPLATDASDTDRPVESLLERLEGLTGRLADQCDRAGTTYQRRGRLITMEELRPRFIRRWQQGERTHGLDPGWEGLRALYRPALGTLNIITGMPGHGKSEWADALAVNMAENHGWRWAVFSPENYPTEIHTQKLVEKHSRSSLYATGPYSGMTADEINEAADWVRDHFVWVEPTEENLTLDAVLSLFRAAIAKHRVHGCIVDPWNELESTAHLGETETAWIGRSLNRCRRFARRHDVAFYIIAHPAKMQRNKQGEYDVPRLYDISGSAHWYNKADNGITVFRHFVKGEFSHLVDVHIQKIKFKTHGHVGTQTFRYLQESGQYEETDEEPRRQKQAKKKQNDYEEQMAWLDK